MLAGQWPTVAMMLLMHAACVAAMCPAAEEQPPALLLLNFFSLRFTRLQLQEACNASNCQAPCGQCNPDTGVCQMNDGSACTTDGGTSGDGQCDAGVCKPVCKQGVKMTAGCFCPPETHSSTGGICKVRPMLQQCVSIVWTCSMPPSSELHYIT